MRPNGTCVAPAIDDVKDDHEKDEPPNEQRRGQGRQASLEIQQPRERGTKPDQQAKDGNGYGQLVAPESSFRAAHHIRPNDLPLTRERPEDSLPPKWASDLLLRTTD